MIDIQQLTSLISAFRVETEKESISPETVGSILQAIADLLATATSETEYNIIRFWKETLQQYRFLYDIQQRNVDDHSNVILQLMARSMVDGATSSLTLAIGPATRTRAGVLTAEDYIRIQGIGETNDELTDTVLEMQDIIDQHTARLNAIGAAGNVLQFFAEGNSDANKVVFSASRYNLFNGAGTMATAALVINGATDQKAGAMTAAHVISLNAAKTDITAFNDTMLKIWQEQITLLGVIDTEALLASPKALPLRADGRFFEVGLSQSFLEYGLWQDYGTGRETPRGNSGDLSRAKKRQRRRWFSRKYYASVMRLKEFYEENVGEAFAGIMSDFARRANSRTQSGSV